MPTKSNPNRFDGYRDAKCDLTKVGKNPALLERVTKKKEKNRSSVRVP